MKIYVDIDGTICHTNGNDYKNSEPIFEHIKKINDLYDEGHTIIYWTARGMSTNMDHSEITKAQIDEWGCKYHDLIMNNKPSYDLLICDKTKRIEEI